MVGSFLVPKWPIFIPFFTYHWYPFYWMLLRPADAIFLKTGWWNTNEQPLWPCSQTYILYYQNSQFIYPSEVFTLDHTFMRHPVDQLLIMVQSLFQQYLKTKIHLYSRDLRALNNLIWYRSCLVVAWKKRARNSSQPGSRPLVPVLTAVAAK